VSSGDRSLAHGAVWAACDRDDPDPATVEDTNLAFRLAPNGHILRGRGSRARWPVATHRANAVRA